MFTKGLLSVSLGIAVLGCGCTNILFSQKDAEATSVSHPKAGVFTQWHGLPYYLPRASIRVDGTWNKESKEWDVKASPWIEAETNTVFTLHPQANVLFDDDVTLGLDTNGLLTTVSATSEDKTVAAIGDLVAAVGNALSFGAGLSPATQLKFLGTDAVPPKHPNKVLPSSSLHLVLNPADSQSITSVWVSAPPGSGIATPNQTNQYAYITVNMSRPPVSSVTAVEPMKDDIIDGVVVRLQRPLTVSITPHIILTNDLAAVFQSHPDANLNSAIMTGDTMSLSIMLPDERETFVLPIKRRYLVKDVTKVGLVNGTVQSLQNARPSIVSGIVGIPKTILSALVPIPLQIRTTVLNNVKAINDTRTAQQTQTEGSTTE